MYTVDNGGTLLCLDINKLEPVWMYDTKDDTDSTIVLEEEEDGVSSTQPMRLTSAVPEEKPARLIVISASLML